MQTPTDEQSSRKSMSMLFIDESRFWQKFFELAALIDLIATVSNKSSGLKLEKNEFELFSILHQSSVIIRTRWNIYIFRKFEAWNHFAYAFLDQLHGVVVRFQHAFLLVTVVLMNKESQFVHRIITNNIHGETVADFGNERLLIKGRIFCLQRICIVNVETVEEVCNLYAAFVGFNYRCNRTHNYYCKHSCTSQDHVPDGTKNIILKFGNFCSEITTVDILFLVSTFQNIHCFQIDHPHPDI
ncbi:hypothetical protein T03_10041 [Trichinella britovi]|uniref:Uncharacterized protein n=1 Tax=Trichinella britovi TaxID=45882 RepID=A0A0V1D9L5_TRIBR|nr:hypothetical protein T03_10041 [Trichinella britovi]